MTMGAMRQFKERTKKDLWFTIVNVWHTFASSSESKALGRLKEVYEVCDFDTAAEVFHALIKAEEKSIPLDEIRDAMFRVGWVPTEVKGEMSEPWPMVMIQLAVAIDEQFSANLEESKKKVTT